MQCEPQSNIVHDVHIDFCVGRAGSVMQFELAQHCTRVPVQCTWTSPCSITAEKEKKDTSVHVSLSLLYTSIKVEAIKLGQKRNLTVIWSYKKSHSHFIAPKEDVEEKQNFEVSNMTENRFRALIKNKTYTVLQSMSRG